MSSYYVTDKVPPEERTNRVGRAARRGGIITVGSPVLDANGAPECFKSLLVGNKGTNGILLVQGIDGSIIPFIGLLAGTFVYVEGFMVVSSATIGGTPYTTDCTNITWQGGI